MKWQIIQNKVHKAIKNPSSPYHGYDFSEAVSLLVRERFISRAGFSSIKDSLILKGGLLLTTVYAKGTRFTIDADLNYSGDNDLATFQKVVDVICAAELNDGFSFSRDEGKVMDHEARAYAGAQFKIHATYGERQRQSFVLDFGVGDVVEPVLAQLPVMDDLNVRSFEIQVYPAETIAAEKLATCVAKGLESSRMKDFFDLLVLRDYVDSKKLEAACRGTFTARKIEIPGALPDYSEHLQKFQGMWNRFIAHRGLRVIAPAPESFSEVVTKIREFYGPRILK